MTTDGIAARLAAALLVAAALLAPGRVAALAPATKAALLPSWLRLDVEYRVESLVLSPLALADERLERATWT